MGDVFQMALAMALALALALGSIRFPFMHFKIRAMLYSIYSTWCEYVCIDVAQFCGNYT